MNINTYRPILSGLLGALLTVWILRAIAKWVPSECARKSAETLIRENRIAIFSSNILFLAGLVGGVLLYKMGYFESNDWRGFGLGFGFATTAPLVWLTVYSAISGHRAREVYVAFSMSQKTPPVVLYGIIGLGAICFFVALSSLLN